MKNGHHCTFPKGEAKVPANIGSHHPIAPYLVITNTIKQITANCLSLRLKKHQLLIQWQTDCQKVHSMTDYSITMNLHLSNLIYVKFHLTKSEHTVATFFNVSRQYDYVQYTKLLQQMTSLSIPLHIMEWLPLWTANCMVAV